MKQIYLLFFSLNVLTFRAQISISQADMPASGDTLRYSLTAAGSIDVTQTGGNYQWHFDTLTPQGQGLRNFSAASQTPYAFFFFGANKYGEKILDSIGFSTFQLKNIYSFYKKTATVFSAEGTGVMYSILPLAAYYTDEDELYQFPLNYSDRDSSTFRYSLTVPNLGKYNKSGYRITEADGWGQITTPYGTAACLRVVTTQYAIDSIVSTFGSLGFPNVMRSYQWLTNTEKIPYLEVSGNVVAGNFVPTQARYRDIARPVGINEYGAASLGITVYPNPVHGKLNVQVPALEGKLLIVVSDIRGALQQQQVWSTNNFEKNQHVIDCSDLKPGVYVLSFRHASAVQTLRVVVE